MKYFNNSTESNSTKSSFDIDLRHLQTTRPRQMVYYNNKPKDQYYPRVYSIPLNSNESYTLKSDQLPSINNVVSISPNPPDPMIVTSQEK